MYILRCRPSLVNRKKKSFFQLTRCSGQRTTLLRLWHSAVNNFFFKPADFFFRRFRPDAFSYLSWNLRRCATYAAAFRLSIEKKFFFNRPRCRSSGRLFYVFGFRQSTTFFKLADFFFRRFRPDALSYLPGILEDVQLTLPPSACQSKKIFFSTDPATEAADKPSKLSAFSSQEKVSTFLNLLSAVSKCRIRPSPEKRSYRRLTPDCQQLPEKFLSSFPRAKFIVFISIVYVKACSHLF